MVNILDEFEKRQINALGGKAVDKFAVGDTVAVEVSIYEGGVFLRNQMFEGVCIAKRNRGLHSSFLVRKIASNGEGVERRFQINSYCVKSVKCLKSGVVRRAKLYYLRQRKGKAARIKERTFVGVTGKNKKSSVIASGDDAVNKNS